MTLTKDIPIGKSKPPRNISPLLMFEIYAQPVREIEAIVCIQNQELHCKKLTHTLFTLFHPYQSNNNLNTK